MSVVERNAQPFSTQSGGQQRKTIGKFVDAFEEAGHDVAGLFAHFLESSPVGQKQQAEVRQGIREVLRDAAGEAEKTLDHVLEAIRELHSAKETKDRERLRIMSLLAPIFTRADLIRRGFRVSNDAFANARKHASNAGPGAPVQVGGRPRVYTAELALAIDHFCCRPEISYANPNFVIAHQNLDHASLLMLEGEQLVEMHDETGSPVILPLRATFLDEARKEIPNRILRVSVQTLHARFAEEHPQYKLSLPGFRSLLPKNVIRRARDGDSYIELEQLEHQEQVAKGKRGRTKATMLIPNADPTSPAVHPHHDDLGHITTLPIAHLPHAQELDAQAYHMPPSDEEDVSSGDPSSQSLSAHTPPRKRPKLAERK